MKRYEMFADYGGGITELEDDLGDWVRWSDVDALLGTLTPLAQFGEWRWDHDAADKAIADAIAALLDPEGDASEGVAG